MLGVRASRHALVYPRTNWHIASAEQKIRPGVVGKAMHLPMYDTVS
jgi:hypothetical protein